MGVWGRAWVAPLLAIAGCAEGGARAPSSACVDGPVPAAPSSSAWALDVAPVTSEAVLALGTAAAPHVAWDGTSWAVAWGARLATLDDHARPLAIGDHAGGQASALDVSTCERAVVGHAARGSTLALHDAAGALERTIAIDGVEADVARGTDRWWVAARRGDAIEVSAIEVRAIAGRALDATPIERIEGASTPRIVATDAGATIAWSDPEGLVVRTLGRAGARAGGARVTGANVWSGTALELAPLRRVIPGEPGAGDHVALAATDGSLLHAAIVDPASDAVVAGPIALARTTSRARPGIATLPEHGLVAICYPAGPRPYGGDDVLDRVEMVVIGAADARPVAPPVEVARGGVVRAVSCAWSGREVLVTWWRTLGDGDQIAARRVSVGHSTGVLTRAR